MLLAWQGEGAAIASQEASHGKGAERTAHKTPVQVAQGMGGATSELGLVRQTWMSIDGRAWDRLSL
jgi:hypothetical protein